MQSYTDKNSEERATSNTASLLVQDNSATTAQFIDNRLSTVVQRNLAQEVNNSPRQVAQRQQLQSQFDDAVQLQAVPDVMQRTGPEGEELLQGKFETTQRVEDEVLLQGKFETAQRVEDEELLQGKFETTQRVEDEELLQGKFSAESVQRKPEGAPNNTGLPDNLKAGIENLSGYSMDDVKVHYNSDKPSQLQAHAYAQGTNIHVASGQEQHLPHEAWHVVQQKQGRVKPTMQMKGKVNVNDDAGLEKEADVMGAKALGNAVQSKNINSFTTNSVQQMGKVTQLVTPLSNSVLNVVGEDHEETEAREVREKQYTTAHAGSTKYWTEAQFRVRAFSFFKDYLEDKRAFADPFELRFNQAQKFLEDNAAIIDRDGAANRNTLVGWDNLNDQRKFINNLWVYLANLYSSFFGADQTDGFEVPGARKTTMLGYRQQIKNIAVTWQAARVDLAAARGMGAPAAVFGWTGGGVAVTSEANARANFARSVRDLAALNVVAETTAQLSQNRSAAMHVTANNRANESGVWKIGDAHRGHLEGEPKPLRYNLVSRAAFNADYNIWNP